MEQVIALIEANRDKLVGMFAGRICQKTVSHEGGKTCLCLIGAAYHVSGKDNIKQSNPSLNYDEYEYSDDSLYINRASIYGKWDDYVNVNEVGKVPFLEKFDDFKSQL